MLVLGSTHVLTEVADRSWQVQSVCLALMDQMLLKVILQDQRLCSGAVSQLSFEHSTNVCMYGFARLLVLLRSALCLAGSDSDTVGCGALHAVQQLLRHLWSPVWVHKFWQNGGN